MASSSYGGSETTVPSHVGQPNSIPDKFNALYKFIYDETDNKIMGRTPISWAKIGLFYLIFYSCLALFFAVTLAVFYQTTDWDYPKLQGSDSLLLNSPGLGIRPIPDVKTTLIRFIKGKPSTFKLYTDHIKAYLDSYEDAQQGGDNFMDCRNIKGFRDKADWEKVCKFDLSLDLGKNDACIMEDDYGYDDGMPCVMIKLNRIYGWMPEPYTNASKDIPPQISNADGTYNDREFGSYIRVICEGENHADKDNIGEIVYFPPQGLHVRFYPYLNQQGYRQPIIFANFVDMTNGVVIMIRCTAYAKNIRINKMEVLGTIKFEMMID